MKVVFVYPDISIDPKYGGYDYAGISYLSAVLKRDGFETGLIHVKTAITDSEFEKRIREASPDLLAFTSTTNMFLFVDRWAAVSKSSVNVPTILGGIHASLQPEDCIRSSGIDMLCVGEGEGAILDVCRRLRNKNHDMSDVPNIWFKKDGKVLRNAIRPFIEDLDSLPFPDKDIFNCGDLITYRIFATRGCPYECSYCFNSAYREIYRDKGRYVRLRSPKSIIEELEYAVGKYKNMREVHFVDDILPLNKRHFKELTGLYQLRIRLPYIAQAHPSLIDEEVIRCLKTSNCAQIQIGIESGNDRVRNSILKRDVTRSKIETAFGLAKIYGIRTYAYNMLGLPFEDKGSVMDTLKLNAKIGVDVTHTSFFYPYPRTELYSMCRENGLIEKEWNIDYFSKTIIRFNGAVKESIVFVRHFFPLLTNIYSAAYRAHPLVRNLCIRLLDLFVTNTFFCAIINRMRSCYIVTRNRFQGRASDPGLS